MTHDILIWGLFTLTLAAGLVSGVFLTFSDFVMKSLHAASPAAGAEAMQVINRKVYNSIFMVLLVGLIPVSAVVAVLAALYLEGAAANWLIGAGVLYFFGVFIASMIGNIPLNRQLEGMPQGGEAAQRFWPSYVRNWVIWNHIRTVTSFGTMAAYFLGTIELAASL